MVQTKYHDILISDHSPLTMSLKWSLPKTFFSWRFNPLLLQESKFHDYIKAAMDEFLIINDNGTVNDSILWETFKAVLRSKIISYDASKKKERRKRLGEIEVLLSEAEKAYTSSSSDDLYSIMKLKNEYNIILSDQINKQIFKLKQKQFELNDKPGKLLTRQLRGTQANRSILKIKSSSGEILTHPQDINDYFRDLYSKLYVSSCKASDDEIEKFLDSVDLPKLSESAKPNWTLILLLKKSVRQ